MQTQAIEDEKVAVVCCATSNWLPAAAVTLLSCLRHGAPANSDFVIMLVGGGPADEAALEAFNARHSTAIRLQHVEIVEKEILNLGRWLGHGIRLTMSRYFDERYRRVLYLDSDVLALQPIDDLLETDLKGYPLGAAIDVGFMPDLVTTAATHRADIGFDEVTPYFNSGVLLFDWRQCLSGQYLQKAVALLPTVEKSLFSEQDILNIVFRGRWRVLPPKWNVIALITEYMSCEIGIKHFTSSPKPWAEAPRFADRTFSTFYQDSLSGTPWSGFVDPRGWRWSLKGMERVLRKMLSFGKRRILVQALERAEQASRV